jgi:hypothetical protein
MSAKPKYGTLLAFNRRCASHAGEDFVHRRAPRRLIRAWRTTLPIPLVGFRGGYDSGNCTRPALPNQ